MRGHKPRIESSNSIFEQARDGDVNGRVARDVVPGGQLVKRTQRALGQPVVDRHGRFALRRMARRRFFLIGTHAAMMHKTRPDCNQNARKPAKEA